MRTDLLLFQVFFWSRLLSAYSTALSPEDIYERRKPGSIFERLEIEPIPYQSPEPEDNDIRGYISIDLLQKFNKMIRGSYSKTQNRRLHTSIDTDNAFSEEVDLIFRVYKGINSSNPVLHNSRKYGNNHVVHVYKYVQVNQPFVESSSKSANLVRSFVSKLSNGSYIYAPENADDDENYHYHWVGGHVRLLSHNDSLLIGFTSKCSILQIQYSKSDPNKAERIAWEIFRNGGDFDNFSIAFFPMQHSSSLCGGDSQFFKEHPSRSQRLVQTFWSFWFTNIASYGNIDEKDMNPGPTGEPAPRIVNINPSSLYFREVLKLVRLYYADRQLNLAESTWISAREQFDHSLAAYNNFGFLLLSIMTLASSTIIAIVTANEAKLREILVVAVEAIVVLLFFIVITYVLVMFTKLDDFDVDNNLQKNTKHSYNNIIITGVQQVQFVYVGKNYKIPITLLITELCAGVATTIVLGNLVRLLWKRSARGSYNRNEIEDLDAKVLKWNRMAKFRRHFSRKRHQTYERRKLRPIKRQEESKSGGKDEIDVF